MVTPSNASPLRTFRRARTLNQATFAKLIGVSQQTLSKYERGTLVPAVPMQATIAAILGVSRHELFPPTAETTGNLTVEKVS